MPTAFLPALFAAALAAQTAPPKAEAILDKYVEVTGGKAYQSIHNQVVSGRMELAGKGIGGRITIYRAEPDLSYTVTELPGVGRIEEGIGGGVAWSNSAIGGARIKSGIEKMQALRSAEFRGELNWRKLFRTAELAGEEDVNGKPGYKVVLTAEDGAQTRYFDKATNLLIKMAMTVKSPMGNVPAETYLEDYRAENGILSSHKRTQRAAGQEIVITFESIRYNVDIPKDRFEIPAAVKALLAK